MTRAGKKPIKGEGEGGSRRRAEERGLSPDGKHPADELRQTRKHRNIHLWLYRQIPGPYHRAATSEYLEIESRNLNFKLFLRVIF